MRGMILSAALAVAALGGCYGEVGYSAGYAAAPAPSGDAYVATPDLVAVSPGVQVVADYDEPVFYTDGFYWRYNDGYWYRSNNYATGWYYYERPPEVVLRIDRPYAYAHYRPAGYVARSRPRYQPAPIVRDHRQPAPVARENPAYRGAPPGSRPPTPAPAPAATPVVRDHRQPPPAKKEETRDHRH